jgi:hypothetical protein
MRSTIPPIQGLFWLSNDLQKTYRSFHGKEFPLEALFFVMIILSTYAVLTSLALTYDSDKKSTVFMKGSLLGGILITIVGWVFVFFKYWTKNVKMAAPKFVEVNANRLQNVFMVTTALFLGMRLYAKVLYGECGRNGASEELYCNSNASTHGLPEDSFIAALMFPITYSTLLRDTDVSAMVASWLITVAFMLISILKSLESRAPSMAVGFYILVSSITLYSNQKQNIRSFVVQQQLTAVIKQNEEMAEELRANELRHMVGNVAHDLKTVSIIILLIFTGSYADSMHV